MHGWQDNAGTFDTLIPLLPKHLSYLALDLPGCGLSSRFPDGLIYNNINYIYNLNFIFRKIFRWSKVSFIGHSMTTILEFIYAATYPDYCDLLIAIEDVKTPMTLTNAQLERYLKGIDTTLTADLQNQINSEPPTYEYKQLIDRLSIGTNRSVTQEAAPYMLERGIKPSIHHPGQYYFSRDNRTKISSNFLLLSKEIFLKMAAQIRCPYLFIKATQAQTQNTDNFIALTTALRENPKFKLIMVAKDHHLHLTDPTMISGEITNFLNKYRPLKIIVTNKL